MYKSYYKFMSDSNECLADFMHACNQMAMSSFIVADGKIAEILKCIAKSSKLFDLFRDSAHGFDFSECLERCRVPYGDEGRYALKLPTDRKEYISFVLALLWRLDTREIALHEFLNTYFFSDDGTNDAYMSFCREVVVDFGRTVSAMFVDIYNVSGGYSEVRDAFFEEDARESSEEITDEDSRLLREETTRLLSCVDRTVTLNSSEKKEIRTVIGGLNNAIGTQSKQLILTMWIGCKNTLSKYGLHTKAERIEKALSTMWII